MTESLRALTELESCVLAVVWRRAPCSAYAVRKVFAESITPDWSSSSGSIYPVLKRLRDLGLVSSAAEAWGKSGKAVYATTPAGDLALRQWLLSRDDALAAPADPVRTRMSFFDALPSADQDAFLSEAERQTADALRTARSSAAAAEALGEPDYRAHTGLVYALLARRAWLRSIRGRRRR